MGSFAWRVVDATGQLSEGARSTSYTECLQGWTRRSSSQLLPPPALKTTSLLGSHLGLEGREDLKRVLF